MRSFLAIAGLLALAACERSGPGSDQYWSQRKTAAEKLELWSIEAVGSKAEPEQICANIAMRLGFVKPAPSVGGAPCELVGKPVESASDYAFRCNLAGQEWAVVSRWQGDRQRDFTNVVSVSSLDTPGQEYAQTRRYRRLGPCPPGWSAGDSHDRQGRRVNRLAPWPASASPPP